MNQSPPHRVVIIGGGFGGLFAARRLNDPRLRVTLIDRRNFHLFQPLLYQVATGGLSPGDIACPLRSVLKKHRNTRVLQADVTAIEPARNLVVCSDLEIGYVSLILATGVRHLYFGHEEWSRDTPGLKAVEDATQIRQRIFNAFEEAERTTDEARRRALLRFVIVGGGPTGVELAGALGELAHATLKHNFRTIDPSSAEIYMLEVSPQVLASYHARLGQQAADSLAKLGVTVRTKTLVTGIAGEQVTYKGPDGEHVLQAATVLWAAGVRASRMGAVLKEKIGAELDSAGRVMVAQDCSLPGYDNLFVIGDLAHFKGRDGKPLPGVAPVAMQQGAYVARLIKRRLTGKTCAPFSYLDKGSLAVIGRNAAVASFGRLRFSGLAAWLLWGIVHISFLIGFGNKFLVAFQWVWSYLTRKRGARLVTWYQKEEDRTF